MPDSPSEDRDLLRPFRPLIDAQADAAETAAKAEAARQQRIAEAAEEGAARQVAAASPDSLLTAAQVAAMLGVREDRVHALGREGKLPRVKLGENTFRYRREAVLAAVQDLES